MAPWRPVTVPCASSTLPSSSGSAPVHAETEVSFRDAAAQALLDPQLRANFRRAMDGLMAKRKAQFPDPADLQELRDLSTAIRSRSLLNLPALLEQFEAKATKNGIQVHWAETCEEANELVLGILRAKGARTLVKGCLLYTYDAADEEDS